MRSSASFRFRVGLVPAGRVFCQDSCLAERSSVEVEVRSYLCRTKDSWVVVVPCCDAFFGIRQA